MVPYGLLGFEKVGVLPLLDHVSVPFRSVAELLCPVPCVPFGPYVPLRLLVPYIANGFALYS